MKFTFLIILILNQLVDHFVEPFELIQLDSNHLFNFFTKSNNNLNNFKTKSPLPSDTSSDLIRQIPVYFEEQCALECLRNTFCARYSYLSENQQKQPVCSIYLRSSFTRPTLETNDNNKLKESLNCNLQTCSNGIYCASSNGNNINKTEDGTCLCDVISSKGQCDDKINSNIKYELSGWSDWSNCSSVCGDGFRSRDRKCLKKYTDRVRNVTIVEELHSQDWLCTNNLNDLFQIETCNLGDCSVFTQWSSWSKCDRLCNGFRSRSRSCTENSDPKLCNSNYLTETQLCSSFEDCNESLLKIKSEGATVANITNKGIIKLIDWKKNTERRLFTQTDDKNLIRSISVVACREFGFNRSVNAVANPVRQTLTDKYTDSAEYLQYVNEQNVNGLNCTGNELTIKDCKASSDAKIETELYEIEVECLFNAYWSTWSSWTPCSVTCGAGARTRIRTCNDPPPSVSQFGNGDTCPAGATDFASCIMPRCKV